MENEELLKRRRIRKRKHLNRYFSIQTVLFAVLIGGLFVLNLFTGTKKISEREKRELAQFPEITANRIISGKFGEDFESYASDQMVLRDAFVCLKSDIDLILGKRDSQGVYRCSDGYFMEYMKKPDESKLGKTLEAIKAFSNSIEADTFFVMVPNAISIYADKLPAFAVTEDQSKWSSYISSYLEGSGVRYDDLTDELLAFKNTAGDKKLYYKTDHHWTTYAAYSVLDRVRAGLGLTDQAKKYEPLTVCDSFAGSLVSKGGFASSQTDSIDIYVPDEEDVYLVTANEKKTATLYSMDGLKSSDPYTVFLGGNSGYVHIETENAEKGNLLVFKDSYFNCFLPFLIEDYSVIDVVDPRYYADELNMLVKQNSYDTVLFFYNMNTFAEDTSISLVLDAAADKETET